eukprot:gb/GECH01013129.1/.p1 GENE.gb/GECH01013129.1/~~gb/GECH01013129.1/.p1  ORF type:complete len:735 (+),score=164.93 gb/GECH01013129.1/:1-2205(+)
MSAHKDSDTVELGSFSKNSQASVINTVKRKKLLLGEDWNSLAETIEKECSNVEFLIIKGTDEKTEQNENPDIERVVSALCSLPKLCALYIQGISNEEFTSSVFSSLSHQRLALRSLRLKNVGLTENSVKCLADSFDSDTTLIDLGIYDEELNSNMIDKITSGLTSKASILDKLTISNCGLSDKLLAKIFKAFADDCFFSYLDISHNEGGIHTTERLCDKIEANSTLSTLNLSNNNIDGKCLQKIWRALLHNTTLTSLLLSNNRNEGFSLSDDFRKFCSANSNLKKLHLNGCGLQVKDFEIISMAAHSIGFSDLNISSSPVGSQGVSWLARLLSDSPYLAKLDVSDTNCGVEGAKCLARGLERNGGLQVLLLRDNNIQDEGATAILETISHRKNKLELIDMSGNQLSMETCSSLSACMWHRPSLKRIILDRNSLDDKCIEALEPAIQRLKYLSLDGNLNTSNSTLRKLAQMRNETLKIVLPESSSGSEDDKSSNTMSETNDDRSPYNEMSMLDVPIEYNVGNGVRVAQRDFAILIIRNEQVNTVRVPLYVPKRQRRSVSNELHAGWLTKLGFKGGMLGKSSWKKRWFRLNDGHPGMVRYYANDKESEFKGEFLVDYESEACIPVEPGHKMPKNSLQITRMNDKLTPSVLRKRNAFAIEGYDLKAMQRRTFYMVAKDSETRDEWVRLFRSLVDSAENRLSERVVQEVYEKVAEAGGTAKKEDIQHLFDSVFNFSTW